MKKILVVEDEQTIRDFVVINLKRSGYEVVEADCGERAIELFGDNEAGFNIAMLDLMMPGIDGFEVCKQIREKNATIGIIMLTAKSQELDKIKGLTMGADDYITKPFSPTELIARVDSLYRRVAIQEMRFDNSLNSLVYSGKFEVNLHDRVIKKGKQLLDLTQNEYQIMEYFIANPGVVLNRKKILQHVWGDDYIGEEKIVDVNVRRLRMKIEDDPSCPQYIYTVWGVGYRWNA